LKLTRLNMWVPGKIKTLWYSPGGLRPWADFKGAVHTRERRVLEPALAVDPSIPPGSLVVGHVVLRGPQKGKDRETPSIRTSLTIHRRIRF